MFTPHHISLIFSHFSVGYYQTSHTLLSFSHLLADISYCTGDSSAVLVQFMDLDPLFAFLLIDVHHVVVRTHCNLCIDILAQKS